MKLVLLMGLMVMIAAGSALGQGAEYLIKKKAMDVRDNNNAAQGITPAAGAKPGAPAAPAAPQGISPAQQLLLDKVQADLAAIKPGGAINAEQKQKLVADILNLSKGSIKASKTTVAKLVDDLSAALADKAVTAKDKDTAQLAKEINIVVNSGNMTATQTQTCVTETQTSLKGIGVSEPAQATLSADLKAINKSLQDSKPNLYK